VSNPTIDNPRRCTLSRRKQPSQLPEHVQSSIFSASSDDPKTNLHDSMDEDKVVLEMDGVHCGDDSGLGSVWEANLRMPAMIQWTGTIPPNTSTMALVSSLDVTPSILSLVFNHTETREENIDTSFDGQDVSAVWLGRADEYDSEKRVLFFWRDGFLLNLEPLGPPFGRFDVVAVKVGRIKAWYWTKSAHYNNDVEVYHYPPLLFDTISDPAEAHPIEYPHNSTSNKYAQLVLRIDYLIEEHKRDIASSFPHPLTLARDPKYIPCINRTTGCRSEPLFTELQQIASSHTHS
jgi:C-terminal region of aryl-sulfatase